MNYASSVGHINNCGAPNYRLDGSSAIDSNNRACRELKMVIVGDKGVGKTALIQQFVHERYIDYYTPTNFDTYCRVYDVGGSLVNFALWDTSGALSSDRVRPLAYAGAHVFLICFSIGNPDSLTHTLTKWHPEIRTHSPSTPILLCGCGSDLRNDIETISDLAKEQRIPVTSEQALRVCRKMDGTTYVETSAKTGSRSVKDAFEMAALAGMGKLNGRTFSLLNHRISFSSSSGTCGRGLSRQSRSKVDLRHDLKGRSGKHCSLM